MFHIPLTQIAAQLPPPPNKIFFLILFTLKAKGTLSSINFVPLEQSSPSKESGCNAGDLSSIPGLGGSLGDGIGYPVQYSWASLVAQLIKNPPAMQETWVQSLGWEDPLEKGVATQSSILACRIPWTIQSMGSQRVGHD